MCPNIWCDDFCCKILGSTERNFPVLTICCSYGFMACCADLSLYCLLFPCFFCPLLCFALFSWPPAVLLSAVHHFFFALLRDCLDTKILYQKTSHQIFGHMHRVLNKIYLHIFLHRWVVNREMNLMSLLNSWFVTVMIQ